MEFGEETAALRKYLSRMNIIGGCCGTTPAHLRAMAEALSRTPRGAAPTREEVEAKLGPIRKVTTDRSQKRRTLRQPQG